MKCTKLLSPYLIIFSFILMQCRLSSDDPTSTGLPDSLYLEWDHNYGTTERHETPCSILQTKDGGYTVAGISADKGFFSSQSSFLFLQLDKDGRNRLVHNLWIRAENNYAILQMIGTDDGGYACVGTRRSKEGGAYSALMFKLNDVGEMEWQKVFQGFRSINPRKDPNRLGYAICQTSDKGFLIAGGLGLYSNSDLFLIKLDYSGEKEWENTYPAIQNDQPTHVIQTKAEEYVVAGFTHSKGAGKSDAWVVKLDRFGELLWDRTYGNRNDDKANCILQAPDGGYVLAGYQTSTRFLNSSADLWILKLNPLGEIEWERSYGGSKDDVAHSIISTRDGGYVTVGYKTSSDYPGTGKDIWVLKSDQAGEKEWDQIFGGSGREVGFSIIQTNDEGFAIAGVVEPKSSGDPDFKVLKLSVSIGN